MAIARVILAPSTFLSSRAGSTCQKRDELKQALTKVDKIKKKKIQNA